MLFVGAPPTPARMIRFEKSLIQSHFQISQLLTK
ncbi:hypothetical protein B8W97_03550 [Staphylococcus haemolyticus]|nr:hypothetical protein B8W97_03550 [Staphylococcus haemolyticus]